MSTWATFLGERRMKNVSQKVTIGEIRVESLVETANEDRTRLEIIRGVNRGPPPGPPPSRNNNYNSGRGLHGRNVGYSSKEIFLVSISRPRKTSPKEGPTNHSNEDYEGTYHPLTTPWSSRCQRPILADFLEDGLVIVKFGSVSRNIRGFINLETTVGTGSTKKAVKIRFTMVNAPTSYNVIYG
ncbi:hypothetical protein CR513_62384, partial [Mucuna pruriens]